MDEKKVKDNFKKHSDLPIKKIYKRGSKYIILAYEGDDITDGIDPWFSIEDNKITQLEFGDEILNLLRR